MPEATVIDVWITKYALTDGVEKVQAEHSPSYPGMVTVRSGIYPQSFHGMDWHRTEADALARAEQMRLKRVAALKKQLARLQKLSFSAAHKE